MCPASYVFAGEQLVPDCSSAVDGDVLCEGLVDGGDILDLIDSQQMQSESRGDSRRRRLVASRGETNDEVNENGIFDEENIAYTDSRRRAVGRTCHRDDIGRRTANDVDSDNEDLELASHCEFFM